MNKFGFCTVILTAIIGLLAVSCVAIKHENRTIEQAENLSILCVKAYKSELKDDQRVQEICRDVQIKLFDEDGE